jgi:hypothetical protein
LLRVLVTGGGAGSGTVHTAGGAGSAAAAGKGGGKGGGKGSDFLAELCFNTGADDVAALVYLAVQQLHENRHCSRLVGGAAGGCWSAPEGYAEMDTEMDTEAEAAGAAGAGSEPADADILAYAEAHRFLLQVFGAGHMVEAMVRANEAAAAAGGGLTDDPTADSERQGGGADGGGGHAQAAALQQLARCVRVIGRFGCEEQWAWTAFEDPAKVRGNSLVCCALAVRLFCCALAARLFCCALLPLASRAAHAVPAASSVVVCLPACPPARPPARPRD